MPVTTFVNSSCNIEKGLGVGEHRSISSTRPEGILVVLRGLGEGGKRRKGKEIEEVKKVKVAMKMVSI